MGNQASKVIERTIEKKDKKPARRRSTLTVNSKSYSSISSKANQDWLENSTSTTTTSSSRRQSITGFFTGNRKKSIVQDDLKEFDRLQRQHYLLKSARKSNYMGTIEDSMTIVDVGTGNGIWALEMASEYYNCKIIGVDIRIPTSTENNKPKNLQYYEFDITQPWPLESNSVDYVFQRNMGQTILNEQWKSVLEEMHRVLKPNGTIELIEYDLCHHNPGPVQKAFDEFYESQCKDNGIDFQFTQHMQAFIEDVGFQQINQVHLDIPIGEWPSEPEQKQLGFINKEIQKATYKNKKNFYISKWGITSEDYEIAVQEVLNEFEEYKGFTRMNCWLAKKAQ